MEKGFTITYEYGDNLYVNPTNRCNFNCAFCLRHNQGSGGSIYTHNLWLKREPTKEEILSSIESHDLSQYKQLVFVGFGEPTYRFDDICWVIDQFVLVPLGLAFLQTLAFILVIAALVQFVEMFLKKMVPSLYSALGIFLPLITTNCAVLGVVLLNVQNHYNFIESLVYGITGGLGFMLAIVLFASVRERVEFSEYPECFEGFPICLVSAALVALAFMGFSGMKIF